MFTKWRGLEIAHPNTLKVLLQESMSIKAKNPAVPHQVNHSNSLLFLLSLSRHDHRYLFYLQRRKGFTCKPRQSLTVTCYMKSAAVRWLVLWKSQLHSFLSPVCSSDNSLHTRSPRSCWLSHSLRLDSFLLFLILSLCIKVFQTLKSKFTKHLLRSSTVVDILPLSAC